MTASAIPRSRWRPCHLFRAPRASFADLLGGTVYGRVRTEFSRVAKSVANWGREKAGRGSPRTGVIHEGQLMDSSIVPNPDPTIQSCCSERWCAPAGSAATIAAAAHTIAQNNTV